MFPYVIFACSLILINEVEFLSFVLTQTRLMCTAACGLQLSSEYEALISEHGLLKSQHKQMKEDVHEVRRSKDIVAKEKAAIEELRQSMHKERLSIQLDDSLNENIKRLTEEKHMVQQQADKVRQLPIAPPCHQNRMLGEENVNHGL